MKSIDPNSGASILEQLKRFGSNVDRKHRLTFWLYFPTQETARRAAQRAKSAGLRPRISPPLKKLPDPKWLCLLYCPHIPDEIILDGISRFCTRLAFEFNGEFDGWETALELKKRKRDGE